LEEELTAQKRRGKETRKAISQELEKTELKVA